VTRTVIKLQFLAGIVSLTALISLMWLMLWALAIPPIRGWTPVAITSGSMEPAIATGDIVIAAPPGDDTLGPGTVIVFDNPSAEGTITHRIVAVDPTGNYVTRGDANARVDSTPVPADTIHGVGRILVPAVGTPLVWASKGQWAHVIASLVVMAAALWASRWAILTRYNPWRHT
jgi:signal peptidase